MAISKDSLISDAIIIGFSKCIFSFGVTLFASVHASKLNEVSDPPVIPENCPVPAVADALVPVVVLSFVSIAVPESSINWSINFPVSVI